MKITARRSVTYIPTWNGNRDLDDDEQVTVEIVFPTQADREELQPAAVRDGENVVIKTNYSRTVKKHARKITGLTESVDGVDRKIETGEQLVNSTSQDVLELITELGLVILRNFGLDEEEKKSLKSASGSTEKKD